MKPILLDWPDTIETPRLILRVPQTGGGATLNAAVRASFDELHVWMPWAREVPSVEESEEVCRRARAKFLAREDMMLQIWLRDESGHPSTLIGGSGLHLRDWDVPCFEIGYWCHSQFQGQGYISETVRAITRFGFDTANANRIFIRCDARNERSRRVAERCGFQYEGTMRCDARAANSDELRDTHYFSLLPDEWRASQS